MKKQYIILLAVVSALLAALFMASCSQPAASTSAAASSAAAESSEAAASADAAASEAAEADATQASADDGEFKSLPAFQPADHAGRTADMCPTCHLEGAGGAAVIPDDHYVGGDPASGELEGARLQCVTCHVIESA